MRTDSCGSDELMGEAGQTCRVARRMALASGLAALGTFTWTQDLDGQQASGQTEGRKELMRQSLPNAPGKEVVVVSIRLAPSQPPSARHTHPPRSSATSRAAHS
jgi:hypothetical protein